MAEKGKNKRIKKEIEEPAGKEQRIVGKEEKPVSKEQGIVNKEKQAKEQNKTLRNILIGIGILSAGIFLLVMISNSLSKFEYRGVDFEITRLCDTGPPCLVLYKTDLPVKVVGKNITLTWPENKTNDYNFYLRKDPRKLDVSFNGSIEFKDIMVLNSEDGFACDGKGAIAAANLNILYQILEIKVIRDENASCDSLGRYALVEVKTGDTTKIEQFGPACYNIYIKDCEILEGTEKFMIETFIKVNGILSNST
ncbi:MAG: hypothetical protein AABW87_02850, partial [Nanoarchaeota archaeon]